MFTDSWSKKIYSHDSRRDLIIPGDKEATLAFCAEHFCSVGSDAIRSDGVFCVALSGGSTPKRIFELLTLPSMAKKLDWSKLMLFWSDERAVSPDHPDSNYRMAMDAGFRHLRVLPQNIFRMEAEKNIESNALHYEGLIKTHVPNGQFHLMMLGMGEDGHTASLFPNTHGLNASGRLVVANFVPQMHCWRMSLTYDCINQARHIAIYVLGKSKAEMVDKALNGLENPQIIPIQQVGSPLSKALWILDQEAASLL